MNYTKTKCAIRYVHYSTGVAFRLNLLTSSPQLLESWITPSTGLIPTQWISVDKTNHTSVIHFLNNPGQVAVVAQYIFSASLRCGRQVVPRDHDPYDPRQE